MHEISMVRRRILRATGARGQREGIKRKEPRLPRGEIESVVDLFFKLGTNYPPSFLGTAHAGDLVVPNDFHYSEISHPVGGHVLDWLAVQR